MNTYIEARASGREAFWHGCPIWANPLTGESAREWTDGWKRALVELNARSGRRVLPAASNDSAEWAALLALYRPDDVAPVRRQRRTMNRPRATRRARELLY